MLEKIKEMLKIDENITCYKISQKLNKNPRDLNVAKNYWKAKYELLLEQVQESESYKDKSPTETLITKSPAETQTKKFSEDTAPEESNYQEGVPNQWIDKEGQVYVKDNQSGIWRVFPYGLEFGTGDVIDEHRVKVRYAAEMLNR